MEDSEEEGRESEEILGGVPSPGKIGSSAEDAEAKTHRCDLCREEFEEEDDLRVHVRSHEKEEPDEDDGGPDILQVELKVKKSYLCEVCGKVFVKSWDLNRHRRVHTGEKPYKCADCKGRFSELGSLRMHQKTVHMRNYPHVCEFCAKGFRNGSDLKRHSVTHTGEKPHGCAVCGKRFSQSIHLKTHLRTHTGEKKNTCRVWNEIFPGVGSSRAQYCPPGNEDKVSSL